MQFLNKKNKKILLWLTKIFLLWRLFLVFVSLVAQKILPFKEGSFPFAETYLKTLGSQLYPLLINKLSFIFNPLITALLISNLAFFAALFLLFKLITLDYSSNFAKKTIVLLLIFPTSFFFGAVYTESLFLLLCIGAFYFARTRKWTPASLLGLFASATRLVGVFLLPAFLFEQGEQKKTKTKELLTLLLIPAGLMLYMIYLKVQFTDPLYFLNPQSLYGASQSSDKIILLHQVIWRYLKMIITVDKSSLIYLNIWFEFLTSLFFLFLIIQLFIKKFPSSYITFSVLSFITPTLTGTFSSTPRYVLVLFPCFIVLSQMIVGKKKLKTLWMLVNIILLALFCGLFTRGYWVA